MVEDALSRIKVTGATDIWEVFAALRIATQPFTPVRRGRPAEGRGQDGDSSLGKIKLVIIDSLASVMLPLITKEDSKQGDSQTSPIIDFLNIFTYYVISSG